jgi:16S rRNA (cytidine1402-2'-O)-methyltransferase
MSDTPPTASARTPGTLFLVPVPLGPAQDPADNLPAATLAAIRTLDCFIAENARTARSVLGRLAMGRPMQSIEIAELNTHTPSDAVAALLAPLLAGRSVGLLSEAGCPAVADPGGILVALAHQRAIRVVPLVGPSALLLALMASGMSGQSFAFVGYLPIDAGERLARIQALERRSADEGQTQIMIETPYRNQALFEALVGALSPSTLLGIASDLSLPEESIRVRTIARWRAEPAELARTPTVFTLAAEPGGKPARLPARPGARPSNRPASGTRKPVSAGAGSPRRR